jgi:hypothetical protein
MVLNENYLLLSNFEVSYKNFFLKSLYWKIENFFI